MVFTLPDPTPESERRWIHRGNRKQIIVAICIPLVCIAGFVAWSVFIRSNTVIRSNTGDPGGRVLSQLTPFFSAVPSDAHVAYARSNEPFQNSCDGIAGTQGWSQVDVQTGFTWSGSGQALGDVMNGRLTELGWTTSEPIAPGEPAWTKTLSNGTTADLKVQFMGPNTWQLDALAPPVGKAASGC